MAHPVPPTITVSHPGEASFRSWSIRPSRKHHDPATPRNSVMASTFT